MSIGYKETEEDKQEARQERLAIMTVEGISEEEAAAYCDSHPEIYGPGK
jgi:hypothetical protein